MKEGSNFLKIVRAINVSFWIKFDFGLLNPMRQDWPTCETPWLVCPSLARQRNQGSEERSLAPRPKARAQQSRGVDLGVWGGAVRFHTGLLL